MGDVFIHRVSLPGKVRGVTAVKDGDYIVFVNENLCDQTQAKAVAHELLHIKLNHFYNEKTAVENEREAAV